MNALIADTPPPAPEQLQGAQPSPPEPGAPAGRAPAGTLTPCANCGAALSPGQDWCLHCGAATPGSVGSSGWRPVLTILAITVVLVLGAAAAGVAALSKKSPLTPVVTTTVAQATPPPPSTPLSTTPTTPLTGVTKPPTIPLKAVTPPPATAPKNTETAAKETAKEKAAKEEGSTGTTGGSGAVKEAEPILLDTNAAQTYNPYGYPAALFGDPSLAIDGDSSTGWTAQINPATAPRLAEGVLIDLKTAQKLSVIKLVTTTPGITVQVYGANGHTVPSSITDKAWVTLSRQLVIHKRHAKIGLRNKKKAYRFVALWISRVPESAVGTPEAPGRVTVNELELLPAS